MKAYDTKCYRSVDIGKGIAGGQDMLSPYQAMGSNPANYVDPDGLKIKINGDIHDPLLTSFLNDWLGGGNYGFDNDNNLFIIPGHEQEAIGSLANYFMTFMGSGGGCEAANTAANAYAGIVMAMINGDNFNGSIVPGQEMDGHIYSGENGVFQIGPNARLANVAINGQKENGENGGVAQAAGSVYASATAIPIAAVGFVTGTKTGKLLSMGGSYVWKSSSYAAQRELIREMAVGSDAIKSAGAAVGAVSALITGVQVAYNQQINASNILDVAVTGASFIPVVGWAIGLSYFAADMITLGITGASIGQHLDNAVGQPVYDWH